MQNLKDTLHSEMTKEYLRAAALHGEKHNSAHEAYAVIKEEFEEAETETYRVGYNLVSAWEKIKSNQPHAEQLEAIMNNALSAAAELVQVAAMAHKALQGYAIMEERK